MHQHINQYRDVELRDQVNTEDPYQFGILMLNGAITFLSQAKVFILENKIPQKAEKLSKVFDIVIYVKTMLDYEAGGEIVKNIEALLEFVQDQVANANILNDIKRIDDSIKTLTDVKECFELCKLK